MGKGEKLDTSNFSFAHCFQKTCNEDMEKPGLVWERVNTSDCAVKSTVISFVLLLLHSLDHKDAGSIPGSAKYFLRIDNYVTLTRLIPFSIV